MKRLHASRSFVLLLLGPAAVIALLLSVITAGASARTPEKGGQLFYAFEMQGKLVGFVKGTDSPGPGGAVQEESRLEAYLRLLGQDFDLKFTERCNWNRESGRVTRYERIMHTGSMETGAVVEVSEKEARYIPRGGGAAKSIPLDQGVVFSTALSFPFLARDLARGREGKDWSYRVLEYTQGGVDDVVFTRLGTEKRERAGKTVQEEHFRWVDRTLGLRGELWIDPATGRLLEIRLSTGVRIYLADPSIVGKIARAGMDDAFFAKVDTLIPDWQQLTRLEVQARISTAGEWVTPDRLNVPGQKFEGTVEDNLIDGVFEIAPARYDGKDAPPFPTDVAADPALKEYLEPEELIEADDPVLEAKAEELTRGAKDAWEAACRLSRWVAKEIAYEIPGGSARQTFDLRKGECGSHSRLLAAFCRSVGIPARLASGCMYTPYFGGSFGQHAWTEVYMGEAGWIAVDATAREVDYVDAGHIRLGSKTAFHPEEMKILEYETAVPAGEEAAAGSTAELRPVAWEPGLTRTYRYRLNGKDLGTDRFTVEKAEGKGGDRVFHVRSTLELQGLHAEGTWTAKASGAPLAYHLEGKAGTVTYAIDCAFEEGKVRLKIRQGGGKMEREIPLQGPVFLADNNNFSLFSFITAAVPLKEGYAGTVKIFHPALLRVVPLNVEVPGKEEIDRAGKKEECFRMNLTLEGLGVTLHLWVDAAGRILREEEQGGRLVVTLL